MDEKPSGTYKVIEVTNGKLVLQRQTEQITKTREPKSIIIDGVSVAASETYIFDDIEELNNYVNEIIETKLTAN